MSNVRKEMIRKDKISKTSSRYVIIAIQKIDIEISKNKKLFV